MKISIMTNGIFAKEKDEKTVYSKIKEIGYDGLDYTLYERHCTPKSVYSCGREVWTKHFENSKKFINDIGLEVFQTHATFPTNYDKNVGISQTCLDQMKREIETTAILGAKYIVVHPINLAFGEYRKQEDYEVNMDLYGKLTDTLKEFDLYLGIENMFEYDTEKRVYVPTGCSLPQDVIQYVEGTNSDRFVSCLDTGHINIHSYPPEKAILEIGDKIKLLHVNDNFGFGDYHNAIGIGNINWDAVVKALKQIGYKGVFSLELKPSESLKASPIQTFWNYFDFAYKSAKAVCDLIENN